ncbi:MAG: hypothetical protein ABI746_13690 [Dermatophilaceae bacterium]
MRERTKGQTQQQAAAKAGLRDRGTVARYERGARPPWEAAAPREYRTRPDPFEADWRAVETMLEDASDLEGKALFEWLCGERPGRYIEGQLRTFQRRVALWRALNVPRMVALAQDRVPGEVMQTDGTCMNGLGITLGGTAFPHLLIVSVLPYSNWAWGTVAQSESLMAVTGGFEAAVQELGYLPKVHQTDSSTAATHTLGAAADAETLRTESGRGYNDGYLAVMAHYGVTPRTTHLGASDENGDAEAINGVLKRALHQHLLLRGSRDFAGRAAYEAFLADVLRSRNALRHEGIATEVAAMRPLDKAPLGSTREFRPRVSREGMVRILENVYTVPSGLVGRIVVAYVDEWSVSIYVGGRLIQRGHRLVGRKRADVNYRHVLPTLLRKPGGFRHYRYREYLFPTAAFRRAWEVLDARMSPRRADLAYLRVLKLAADGLETDVHHALELLIEDGGAWDDAAVESLVRQAPPATMPVLTMPSVDLQPYDALLSEQEVACDAA